MQCFFGLPCTQQMFVEKPTSVADLAASCGCEAVLSQKVKLYNVFFVVRRPAAATDGGPSEGETQSTAAAINSKRTVSSSCPTPPPLEVLLGHKARGHGAGNWNGFGGKVEAQDANIAASAARELEEECGLRCDPSKLDRRGVIWFRYPEQPHMMEVHVYVASAEDCSSTVVESEEMTPILWTPVNDVPLEKMWADDPFWLPQLFHALGEEMAGGQHVYAFTAFFDFAEGFKTIVHHAVSPFVAATSGECASRLSESCRSDRAAVDTQ